MPDTARRTLQAKAIAVMEGDLAKHTKLVNTFDMGETAFAARDRLKEIKAELVLAKDVWDTGLLCELQFSEWKKTLWNDINTDEMEEASKAFVKEVRALHRLACASVCVLVLYAAWRCLDKEFCVLPLPGAALSLSVLPCSVEHAACCTFCSAPLHTNKTSMRVCVA